MRLKLTFCFMFFYWFLISEVNSQTKIGIKAGINISNEDASNSPSRLSIALGFYHNKSISKKWSIQPEVWYSGEGVRYPTNFSRSTDVIVKHAVRLPVLMQYRINSLFYVEAGPQVGLVLHVTEKIGDSETKIDISNRYRKFLLGIGIGLGYQMSKSVSLNIRYNKDMSNYSTSSIGMQSGYFYQLTSNITL